MDVLFKHCQSTIRIPSKQTTQAHLNTRPFIFHGEQPLAYVVVTIANTELARLSLAQAMERSNAPELRKGKFAISLNEFKQFFLKLRISITGYHAQTAAVHNSENSNSKNDTASSHRRRVVNISSPAMFKTSIHNTTADQINIRQHVDGTQSCSYPFVVDNTKPVPNPETNAVLLEISMFYCQDELPENINYKGSRNDHLEELTRRLLSDSMAERQSAPPHWATVLSERMGFCSTTEDDDGHCHLHQHISSEIIEAHPIVSIYTRIHHIPRGNGVKGAILLQVEVVSRDTKEWHENLELDDVQLKAPEWHAQALAIQSINCLPFKLRRGSRWQTVFRLDPLVDSVQSKISSLNLINQGKGTICNDSGAVSVYAKVVSSSHVSISHMEVVHPVESAMLKTHHHSIEGPAIITAKASSRPIHSTTTPASLDIPLFSPLSIADRRTRAATINALSRSSFSSLAGNGNSMVPYRNSVSYHSTQVKERGLSQTPTIQRPETPSSAAAQVKGSIELSFRAPSKVKLGQELAVRVHVNNRTSSDLSSLLILVDEGGASQNARFGHGLLSIDSMTPIPPLQSGQSIKVTLRFIAAAPRFHTLGCLSIISNSDRLNQKTQPLPFRTLAAVEDPFVIFVDSNL